MPNIGPQVRYPNEYVWFIFASAMDLMMTWIVLFHGGREANSLASTILDRFGLIGMVIFKFSLVIFVICLCEFIGRRNDRAARGVASLAVVITCVPVILAAFLLLTHQPA